MKLLERVLNPREIRRRLGLNQEQFLTQIGVTQSGGSRYESGREMPRPVRELLRLVHVEQIDLSQVKRIDFEIISYSRKRIRTCTGACAAPRAAGATRKASGAFPASRTRASTTSRSRPRPRRASATPFPQRNRPVPPR